jgi:hypothetical protein
MTKDYIKKLREILHEIKEAPISVSGQELEDIIKRVGVSLPTPGMDSLKDKCIRSIYTHLQTEIMVKACASAKWSCRWAAVAAFMSAVSAIAALIAIFGN